MILHKLSHQLFNLSLTLKILTDMLKYAKEILSKVSFDKNLFEKELLKAIKLLLPVEIKELKEWCYKTFGHIYSSILERCFVKARV